MNEIAEYGIKAGVLAVFALLLLFVNIKIGSSDAAKFMTFIGMIAALLGSAYFVILVVIS